ncbi:MAG: NTPase [Candidatus Cloacimonadota bacterium]|nr:NTPase [Candidatus Cloacimonadota bacterium]
MKNNILITGFPNIGKTTLMQKVREKLTCKIGGFITYEKFVKGTRTGFYIEDFSGNRMTMADINLDSPYQFAQYGVSIDAFEKIGIPALYEAQKNADIILIDEIGTMESFSDEFCTLLIEVFNTPKPLLATIKKKDSVLTSTLKNREDVLLFNLTTENRNLLVGKILEKVEKNLRDFKLISNNHNLNI